MDADLHMTEMRDLFFAVAWRDRDYVHTWFTRLSKESYLFPDPIEFKNMVEEGANVVNSGKVDALRDLVKRMLSARVALGASDTAGELATIVKA